MAKKNVEFDDLDLDDLDGLDLDFDGGDLFPDEDDPGSRTPVSEFKKGAITSFKDTLLGRESVKRLIGVTLGKGFSEAVDTYDELSEGVSKVVGDNEQEGRKLLRDTTGILDENAPSIARRLPRWIRKASDGIRDEHLDSDGENEDDSELEGQISGINDLLTFSKKSELERIKREEAGTIKSAQLTDSTIRASSKTISAIRRLSEFNEKVTINYQRKSLEQGYRIINILAKTHQLGVTQSKIVNEALSSIQKNTALPDFVKMKGAEFLKQQARNRLADATVNKLGKGIAPIVERVSRQVREGIAAAGMVTDQLGQSDGVSPGQMIGGMAGEWAGNIASKGVSRLGERFRPQLEKLPGFNRVDQANNLLRRYTGNLPMLLNTLAEQDQGNETLNEILRFLAPDNDPVKLTATGMEELDDPSYFDVQTHRTINDIIPAYLASMDQNLYRLATGEERPEQVWSHFDGELTSKAQMLKGVMSFGIKEGDNDVVRYQVDRILDDMGAWDLSESSKNALRTELTKRLLKGVGLTPEVLVKDDFWKDYPDHVGREIRSLLSQRFGINPEGKFTDLDKENQFWDFHKESYEKAASSVNDYTNRFKEYTSLTGVQPWLESGILHRSPTGEYELDENRFVDELLNPNEDYSFTAKRRDMEERQREHDERKAKYRDAIGGVRDRLMPWRKNKEETDELRAAVKEDAAVSTYNRRMSALDTQIEKEGSNRTPLDALTEEALADPRPGLFSRMRDRFSNRFFSRDESDESDEASEDTSVATRLKELKNVLVTRTVEDILDPINVRYDGILTRKKAKELRDFLTNTKAGQLALKHLRKGEEMVAKGAFRSQEGEGDEDTPARRGFFSRTPRQDTSGFSDTPASLGEDTGTHTRLDTLNETQVASQLILTEMLELLAQLPYVIQGNEMAGLNDPVVRNRQTRMQRLSRFMRQNPVSKAVGNTAQGVWSTVGVMGRGIRGTMGLGIRAGELATKTAKVGVQGAGLGIRAGGNLALAGARGLANVVPGLASGAGSLAKGAGGLVGGTMRGVGAMVSPLLGVAGEGLAGASRLAMTAAKSPVAAVKMIGKGLYGGKDEYRDYDAYVKGEESPRILATRLKGGEYKDMDGNPITSLDRIGGPLFDQDDNIVIKETEVEAKITLYTRSGKELIKLGGGVLGTGKGASLLRRVTRPVRKVTNFLTGAAKGIIGAPLSLLKSAFSRIKQAASSQDPAALGLVISHEQLEIQYKIFQLLEKRLPEKGRGGEDDGDEPDANSWEGRLAARKERRRVTAKDIKESIDAMSEKTGEKLDAIKENTEEKKEGLLSRIFGGLTSLGGIIKKGITTLVTAIMASKFGDMMRGGRPPRGGPRGPRGPRGGALGRLGGFLARGAAYLAPAAGAAKGLAVAGAGLIKAGAVWGAGAVAGVVSAPVLIVAGVTLAAAAGGYFLYKGYQSGKAKDFHLTYLRMVQYGVDPTDTDVVGKIAALEAMANEHVKVDKQGDVVTSARLSIHDIDPEAFFPIFGYSTEQFLEEQGDESSDTGKLMEWLMHRFIPVYQGHVHASVEATGRQKLSDLDERISGPHGLKYLTTLKTALTTYFRDTKYGSPEGAYKDRSESPFYSNWFRKDVWADEDDIQDAYDRAEVHFRSMASTTAADSETGLTPSFNSRSDRRQIQEMKENSTLRVGIDGTTDLLEINAGIQGGGFFTSAYGANDYVQGDEFSMTKNLEKLDAGSAIRYMAYGLTKMDFLKVDQLWSLEMYVMELMPANATRFQTPAGLEDKALAIFNPDSDERRAALSIWLHSRFLRVLEAFVQALMTRTNGDVVTAYSRMTATGKHAVMREMLESVGLPKEGENQEFHPSVWTITDSPWADLALNTDPGSVQRYMDMLEGAINSIEMEVAGLSLFVQPSAPEPDAPLDVAALTSNRSDTLHNSVMNAAMRSRQTQSRPRLESPRTNSNVPGVIASPEEITSSGMAHQRAVGPGAAEGEQAMLQAIREAGITDPNEIAMILGQVAEESGEFSTIEENLNYSADRMAAVWPSRFRHRPDFARRLADAGPEAIANEVYARESMGNTEPGDGWKYRGRGYIQLTGKNNYRRVGEYLGVDLVNNPDLVSTPEWAAKTAIAWWMQRGGGIRREAQSGNVRQVTKLVNGGYTNLDKRQAYVNHYQTRVEDLLENFDSAPAGGQGESHEELLAQESTPQPVPGGGGGGPSMVTLPDGSEVREDILDDGDDPTIVRTNDPLVRQTPPVSAQMSATPPPASDPSLANSTGTLPPTIARPQSQGGNQPSSTPTPLVAEVNVHGDEETRGLMGSQLTTQQGMMEMLASIDRTLREGTQAPQTVEQRSTPTRSGPTSRRRTA